VLSLAVVPPGYKYDTASSSTVQCGSGSYRSGWSAHTSATSCTSCGAGISSDGAQAALTVFSSSTNNYGDVSLHRGGWQLQSLL